MQTNETEFLPKPCLLFYTKQLINILHKVITI